MHKITFSEEKEREKRQSEKMYSVLLLTGAQYNFIAKIQVSFLAQHLQQIRICLYLRSKTESVHAYKYSLAFCHICLYLNSQSKEGKFSHRSVFCQGSVALHIGQAKKSPDKSPDGNSMQRHSDSLLGPDS